MYTGTLINELMNTAERVRTRADQNLKEELHEIFTMQIAFNEGDPAYQGAA